MFMLTHNRLTYFIVRPGTSLIR